MNILNLKPLRIGFTDPKAGPGKKDKSVAMISVGNYSDIHSYRPYALTVQYLIELTKLA